MVDFSYAKNLINFINFDYYKKYFELYLFYWRSKFSLYK